MSEYGLDATDLADALHLAAAMKQAADGGSRLSYGHLHHLPFTEPLPVDPGTGGAERQAGTAGQHTGGTDREGAGAEPDTGEADRETGGRGQAAKTGQAASPPAQHPPGADPSSPVQDPLCGRLDDRPALLSAFGLFNLKLPRGRPEHLDLTDTARNYARALLDTTGRAPDIQGAGNTDTGDTGNGPPGDGGADGRGQTGVPVLPSLRPGVHRAVRLSLVVDTGVSMLFQRGVVDDLTRLLRHSGIFRSVDLLGFDPHRPGPAHLVAPDGRPRNLRPPGESGPHITLILTDGLGAAWSDAGFQGWIADAARGGAVAVLHLLHPQLWQRGGIRTEPTRIRAAWPARPGGPNTGYLRERTLSDAEEGEGKRPRGTLVPVLPLSAAALHDWASFTMVRSRSRLWAHVAEYPDPGSHAGPEEHLGGLMPESVAGLERDALPADEAVLRFRRTASPEAFELAVALAAVPLHPAVVAEVCRDVLGRTSPSELTEVFFSGLVRLAEGVLDEDPKEEVRWAFRPGVRARLLALGGEVPEIRRMLRLTARVLSGRDPWFDDLARMLDGEPVGRPRVGAGTRVWVEPMLPALRSAAVARRYHASVDIYARESGADGSEADRPVLGGDGGPGPGETGRVRPGRSGGGSTGIGGNDRRPTDEGTGPTRGGGPRGASGEGAGP